MEDTSLIPPGLYQNTNYSSDRTNRKSIVIDKVMGTGTSFDETLVEPIVIDKHSEVYLEALTTWGAKDSFAVDNMGFILKVNEFNMKSVSNSSKVSAGLIIPNEIGQLDKASPPTASGTGDELKLSKSHKGKKLNYICSMNPTKLFKISGSLTDLNSGAAFESGGRVLLEFVFISKE